MPSTARSVIGNFNNWHRPTRPGRAARQLATPLLIATLFAGACAPSVDEDQDGSGGMAGRKGGSGGKGTGGSGSGGAVGSGGTGVDGSGGTIVGSGGSDGSGGTTGSGGSGSGGTGSGGTGASTGGMVGSGGRTGSGGGPGGGGGNAGGTAGAGGTTTGSGGTPGTGGAAGGGPVGPMPDAATRMRCTGTSPITCHFGGQPGNYDVTVVLGGSAAATTSVKAETQRTMLPAIATTAGQTMRFTFTVNVRQPEGQPIQDVPAGTSGLDLYFAGANGATPRLDSIGYAAAAKPVVLYLAGDSTVCDQNGGGYGGWGQEVPQYFNYPVSVANYADSGESSTSFVGNSSLFGAINTRLKANDWVFIQFGHNDKKATENAYEDALTKMVMMTKAKGAFPVLITPMARAQFSGNTLKAQHVNEVGVNLPQVMKRVAMEQKVPLLDLLARTSTWLTELGPNGWQMYFAMGNDGPDATHTNPKGAAIVAGFVRELMRAAPLTGLVDHLR